MTISEELLIDWQKYSIDTVGGILPINYIGIADSTHKDDEQNSLQIGYAVPDTSPPLTTKTDKKVRLVLICYDIDSLAYEQKH